MRLSLASSLFFVSLLLLSSTKPRRFRENDSYDGQDGDLPPRQALYLPKAHLHKTIRDRRRIFLLGSSTNLATELPAEQLTRPHTEASRRMLRANSCTEFNTNLRNTIPIVIVSIRRMHFLFRRVVFLVILVGCCTVGEIIHHSLKLLGFLWIINGWKREITKLEMLHVEGIWRSSAGVGCLKSRFEYVLYGHEQEDISSQWLQKEERREGSNVSRLCWRVRVMILDPQKILVLIIDEDQVPNMNPPLPPQTETTARCSRHRQCKQRNYNDSLMKNHSSLATKMLQSTRRQCYNP
ncbi:hypothetical protein FPQ18DRAFT_311319 [Pyronema domesticum]|nr:hypothetical protein FPQ18DRAFT_311319 [Pyronema domesticum]